MSGVGKGVASSSIGKILQDQGYKVAAIKIDPYINIDAGTMNPVEHGEVFVTEDGLESDQDLGNYERFLDVDMRRFNYMTTGAVYESVIHKERNLEFGGRCVEVVPDIPNEVISRVEFAAKKTGADFTLIEIGGTVGEYQNLLFLEAARMMKLKNPEKVMFVMVSYLPIPDKVGEMKTKPTQYAARTLNTAGIQPDFIIARSRRHLDAPRKRKIAVFCNIKEEDVISAPDIETIYEVPVNFRSQKLDEKIISKFKAFGTGGKGGKMRRPAKNKKRISRWEKLAGRIKRLDAPENKKTVNIGIVGKYFATGKFVLADSYISVIEAVKHAAWGRGCRPNIEWIASSEYEKNPQKLKELKKYDGIIVPGGFGTRGVEGKIKTIGFARKEKIPYLGLCYGMQLAVIEAARNLARMKKANSVEIDPDTPFPVIHVPEDQKANLKNKSYGGSMRLGAYPCEISGGAAAKAYKEKTILERHRHRYEFNNDFRERLEKAGLVITGLNKERDLVEIIEMKKHPFFVGVQFHPEFKSRPLAPHPLFREFVKSAIKKRGRH